MRFFNRPIRLLAVLALFAPAVILTASPASATESITIEFVGEATIGGDGLCSPVVVNPSPGVCNPRTRAITAFASTACVGEGAPVNKPNKPLPVVDAFCSFSGGGSVTGNCGLSSGSVGGALTLNGQGYTFTVGWAAAVGGTIPITGTITKNSSGQGPNPNAPVNIAGVVQATPNPLTPGTCSNGDGLPGEDSFIFAGAATAVLT